MIPFWETKRKGSGLIELKNYWMPYSYTLCIVSVESQRGTHSGSGVRLQEGVWREKRKSRHVTCFSQAPQGRNMLRGHGPIPGYLVRISTHGSRFGPHTAVHFMEGKTSNSTAPPDSAGISPKVYSHSVWESLETYPLL